MVDAADVARRVAVLHALLCATSCSSERMATPAAWAYGFVDGVITEGIKTIAPWMPA
jgi:hypothetical protein